MVNILEKEIVNEDWKKLISLYGNSASEALLEFTPKIFKTSGIQGFIGYRLVGNCAISFGDPICPLEQREKLATAFYQDCQKQNLHIIYLIVSKKFAEWSSQNQCKVLIEAGEELIFDPQQDFMKGTKRQNLRNDVRHAAHLGIRFREYININPIYERAIEEVGKKWLQARHGAQIHLGDLDFFKERDHKRWFYLQLEDSILGMALLTELIHLNGWFLKFLITSPECPRGSSELLMVSILETLRKEQCNYLTYGVVPLKCLGQIDGLHTIATQMVKFTFKVINRIFHLDQRKKFWTKFDPKTEPAYILFSQKIGVQEVRALAKSLKIELF